MTGTQQASRTRSLGASLLDQVLAETLDPAYAQAAQARAARPAPSRGARARGQALVAATMVLAGLLAALTYDQASAGSAGREQIREALIADIDRESGVTDDLVATLSQLQTDVGAARDQALSSSLGGQRALAELARQEAGAATEPVSGPGLRVTLGNTLPSADDDPVAGGAETDQVAQVLDRDLQLLVNSLWAAGAEAISVDGQRLGPTTTIRQAGGAILVDLRPVTSPYEVLAIGDRDALYDGFITSPEARYLGNLQITYDWVFTFGRADDLQMDGAGSAELRAARPVEPADASATPPGGATPTTAAGADDGD
ncbi:Uncharacterized conserved protein YlxW, UPF0749 family [Klenkia marina]|uniref:Uncharacterized conserved protein YlxW, UPF0749 family n=1 Tax=Klenkia marina TaxID=1960309 RepID=A0A1G4YM61_9ACTN|nr:DUF881 domain-containing protein [Klenkia marina]SCX54553.1 Uncharacterized conserved protein YlxW, UPF0749 family [Klenkia marina]